jgi:hypothetical protein
MPVACMYIPYVCMYVCMHVCLYVCMYVDLPLMLPNNLAGKMSARRVYAAGLKKAWLAPMSCECMYVEVYNHRGGYIHTYIHTYT